MSVHTTAIVLAAGQGKRMQSSIQKQYLLLADKPVLYYSLKAFEDSFVDSVILVVGKGEEEYCQKEIIDKYDFCKISAIVEGGKERYHSVANGLRAISAQTDYVFIHDGARPFITNDILLRALEQVKLNDACVVGMPVKDTVKISDEEGFVEQTPPRARVWQVQTPQVFAFQVVTSAYRKLVEQEAELEKQGIFVTDDAMVVEYFEKKKVRLVEGSYQNIKITTPEDLNIAESFLQ